MKITDSFRRNGDPVQPPKKKHCKSKKSKEAVVLDGLPILSDYFERHSVDNKSKWKCGVSDIDTIDFVMIRRVVDFLRFRRVLTTLNGGICVVRSICEWLRSNEVR